MKIFEPISKTALIYIDDILLFSDNADSHHQLLLHFGSLLHKYGIMISPTKCQVGHSQIDFFGMKIDNKQFTLQPHIASQLTRFPDENLSNTQLQ